MNRQNQGHTLRREHSRDIARETASVDFEDSRTRAPVLCRASKQATSSASKFIEYD